jgi:hypothetical protein
MASKPLHGLSAGRPIKHLSGYLIRNSIGEVFIAEAGFRAGPG